MICGVPKDYYWSDYITKVKHLYSPNVVSPIVELTYM